MPVKTTLSVDALRKATACIVLALFSLSSVAGENIIYEVDGINYEGYFTSAGKEAPLILLVHDWDGLTDYEIKRADMLVEQGYSVIAADLFGKGVRPTEVKDKKQHTGELYQDRAKMRKLVNAALEQAEQKGADLSNAVAMGYCFGGSAVLELARSGKRLRGFASFHGGLATPENQDYSKTDGKIIVFHGTADSMIPMDHVATLANELESNHVPHEIISYGGAPHAFTVFGSQSYRQDADENSWDRFLSFLEQVAL